MKSFPFDSDVTYDAEGNPEYDRGADSTLLAQFLHLMFTDGVFPNPSTGMQVTASSEEMSVVVKSGNCMIQGRMGIEEADRTLVFNAPGTTYDRIDSVVARLNTNHDYRDIDLYVIKGTEASSPTAPALTRTGGIYELRLANVFIAKNTTLVSAERITDTRLTDECGVVTSNPNPVDTTAIFDQYQASLNKYMKYVQECIDGTTAGDLQTQINELKEKDAAQDEAVGKINESLSKKQDASTAITTSNISSQNVNSVGGSTIDDIHADAQKRVNTRQEKLIMELYTASTNTNYAIVNKEGYTLLSAHSVRDDSSYFIKGINKRNDGRYTLIIDGLTSSATMSFWLTWAKE